MRNTTRLHKLTNLAAGNPTAQRERRGLTLVVLAGSKPLTLHLGLVAALVLAAVVGLAAFGLFSLTSQSASLQAQLDHKEQAARLAAQREAGLRTVVDSQQRQLAAAADNLSVEQRKLAAVKEQIGGLQAQLAELKSVADQVRGLLEVQPSDGPQGGQINPAPRPAPPASGEKVEASPTAESTLNFAPAVGGEDLSPVEALAAQYQAEANHYQLQLAALSGEAERSRQTMSELLDTVVGLVAEQQAADAVAEADAQIQAEEVARSEAAAAEAAATEAEAARLKARREADARAEAVAVAAAVEAARIRTYYNTPRGFPGVGEIASGFGWRKSPFSGRIGYHGGLDIAADAGTPVVATANGIVVAAGWDDVYGRYVKIRHPSGYTTLYGHNSRLLVKYGQAVDRGDIIARVGSTGASTGPHIHYGVYNADGVALNPLRFRK